MSYQYALECQFPFSEMLVTGEKSIETRSYSLPTYLRDVPVYLIETPRGIAKVSGLGNTITVPALAPTASSSSPVASVLPPVAAQSQSQSLSQSPRIIGELVFSGSFLYASRREWVADVHKHCVAIHSQYAWKEDEERKDEKKQSTPTIYGWTVKSCVRYSSNEKKGQGGDDGADNGGMLIFDRKMRSIFERRV